jgi:thioester reductase-like protein
MPRAGHDSVVLVTGFPSFLAKKLALHLVATEPRTLVVALVKAADMVEARHAIDPLDPHDRERITLLEGDPAAIDLGLSGVELRQLAGEVDVIHHAAHVSFLGTEKKPAEEANVVSTGEVVEVAKLMTNLRCFVHHSTAFVSGNHRGIVYEDDLAESANHRNVIEETRAHAERIVRRAAKDLPVAIVRPTLVVGDSGTGEIGRLNLPYLFTLLILATPGDVALPIPARGDVPLPFVPMDFVVRAACAIGADPRSPGRTFHLVDPAPLPVKRYIELVHQLRERRGSRMLFSTFARSMLRTPGIEGYLRNPKALVDQLLTNVRYDAQNADRVLRPLDITCPPLSSYAEKIVAAVEERLMGRPAVMPEKPAAPPSQPPPPPTAKRDEESTHETDAMD